MERSIADDAPKNAMGAKAMLGHGPHEKEAGSATKNRLLTGDTAGEICSSTTSPIASSPSFVITSFHLDSIALRDFRGC